MFGNDTPQSLEDRVALLERQLASLNDDPSVGAILKPGKFSLKWPARIQGPNGDAYIVVRQAGGVLSSVPAAEYSDSQWHDGDYWDWLPVGTIWQYVGLEADIPQGWHLCDGTNGTTDFSGYFILASSLEDAGVATEATSAVLDDHAFTQPSNHDVSSQTATPSASAVVQSGSGATVASSAHNHDFAFNVSHGGGAVDAHAFTSEPTPASFTLAFIQKVS